MQWHGATVACIRTMMPVEPSRMMLPPDDVQPQHQLCRKGTDVVHSHLRASLAASCTHRSSMKLLRMQQASAPEAGHQCWPWVPWPWAGS